LLPYWVLKLLEAPERQEAAAVYGALFRAARARGAALAGYISRSRSAEVANLLRFCRCDAVAAGGALCDACRARFPRAGGSPAPCYADLDGVLDRHLFADLLGAGDRSAVFRSPGAHLPDL